MAEDRRLIQDKTGTIYVYTDALAKRKDMSLVRDGERVGVFDSKASKVRRIPIELQGNTFVVEPELHAVLLEMGEAMVGLQSENETGKKAACDFEALKERLTTDIQDLEEQLAKAKAAPAAHAGPAAKPRAARKAPAKKATAAGTEG